MKKNGRIWIMICIVLGLGLILGACDSKSKQVKELMKSGMEYLDSKEYERAIKKFDEALKVKDAARLGVIEMDLLKYRAEAEFKAKDYLSAAHTYSLLADAEKDGEIYLNLRIICLAKSVQEVDYALELYEAKGLDRHKHLYTETTMELIKALVKKAESTEDGTYRDKAVGMLTDLENSRIQKDANIANSAGMIYFRLKNYQKALQWFELGLGYEPENDILLYNQAVCHEFLGDYETALQMMEAYNAKFGESDETNHEIAFLRSRLVSE